MNVSRFVAAAADPGGVQLHVDLLPDVELEQLAAHFDPARGGRKGVAGVLQTWLPKAMVACLLHRAGVPDGTTLAELPRGGRLKLIDDLKRLPVPLCGTRGYPKAEVTSGGVSTRQVDPHSMASRVAPGLYLAGEILDIDGPIGGFNFQAAFSTGHLAGLHVQRKP